MKSKSSLVNGAVPSTIEFISQISVLKVFLVLNYNLAISCYFFSSISRFCSKQQLMAIACTFQFRLGKSLMASSICYVIDTDSSESQDQKSLSCSLWSLLVCGLGQVIRINFNIVYCEEVINYSTMDHYILANNYPSNFRFYCNPSMKSKRIVYFDQNTQQKTATRVDSSSKKNLSISKSLRQSSATKHHKTHSGRLSGIDKGNGAQKIKILVTKDGFIFEKKYMIYDIQCTLVKQEKLEPLPERMKDKAGQLPQEEELSLLDQDYLFLNLETNSLGVTKGLVRHNFNIDKDSAYIQVRAVGYSVYNIIISNKKIEFVLIHDIDAIDDQDVAIIDPIKMIEDSQAVRQEKIKEYFQKILAAKHEGRRLSKSLKICWTNQNSLENAEHSKNNMKKPENEPSTLHSFSINNFFQPGKQNPQRQVSKKKVSYISMASEGNKSSRESRQKANLNEFMKIAKQKDASGPKLKTGSRKFLNDSGLSYGVLGKLQGKQNGKREDAYGLEEINKRSRNKTTHNEEPKKITDDIELKNADMQPNRYGDTKKNT